MHKLEKIFKELKGGEIFNTGYCNMPNSDDGSEGYLILLSIKEEIQKMDPAEINKIMAPFITRLKERLAEEYLYVFGGRFPRMYDDGDEKLTIVCSDYSIYITLVRIQLH